MYSEKNDKPALKGTWYQKIFNYNKPSTLRSIWQILNSVIPFLIIWYFMYQSLEISYWLTLGLSVLACGFSVRIFIIFHDCGHGSFFKSKNLNTYVGMFLGLFSFTPYYKWKRSHDAHHQTVGNLDKRGEGDIKTLTLDEFSKLPYGKRLFYKLYRNPLIMFPIGGLYVFLIQNRITSGKRSKMEQINTHLTTLVIIGIILLLGFTIGFKNFFIIHFPILFLTSTIGVFLFYIQHQYEKVIWSRKDEWDYKKMALEGSSHFKLPKVLQWFTGNIGIHHIHHLSPKIPNYYLEKCLNENTEFQIAPITLKNSFKCLKLRLWDEEHHRIISFKAIDPNAV